MGWYDDADEYYEQTWPHDGRLSSLPAEWQRELVALMLVNREVNNGGYLFGPPRAAGASGAAGVASRSSPGAGSGVFFTPKGWDSLAQGEALGQRPTNRSQPEGLRQVAVVAALQAAGIRLHPDPGRCPGLGCPTPSG